MRSTVVTRASAILTIGVVATAGLAIGASPASADPQRGSASGSGSSTLTFVVGRPAVSKLSTGTFRAGRLGQGTYALGVGQVGIATSVSLTVTTNAGSIDFFAGPMIDDAPAGVVLTASSGTGRFRHTHGTATITRYDQTNVVCDPAYPTPVVCSWDETFSFTASLHRS
jgi:hypothetical protein